MRTVMHIEKNKPESKWYLKRWVVIFLILSMGPLAFFNLWRSREFSPKAKVFWAIVTLVFTVVVVVGSQMAYQRILDDAQKQLGGF